MDGSQPAIGVGLGVGDGVGDGLGVGVGDGLGVGVGLGSGVGEGVGLGSGEDVGEGVGVGLGSGVGEGVGLGSGVGDGLGSGVGDGLGSSVGDGVGSGVGDGLDDGLGSGVGVGLGSGVGAGLGSGVGAGLGSGVGDGDGVGIGVGVGEGVGVGLGVGVGIGVGDGLAVWDGLGFGLPGFGVGLAGGVVGDALADADGLGEGVADGLGEADGLTEGEGGRGEIGGFAMAVPAMSPPNTSHAATASPPIAAARTGPRGLVGGWSTLGLVTDRGCPGRRQPPPSPVRARNKESCTPDVPECSHLVRPIFLPDIRGGLQEMDWVSCSLAETGGGANCRTRHICAPSTAGLRHPDALAFLTVMRSEKGAALEAATRGSPRRPRGRAGRNVLRHQ